MEIEIKSEINEDTGAEEFEVWDNDELIYEGYFEESCELSREERALIILANAFGFEPANLLNLDIFLEEEYD